MSCSASGFSLADPTFHVWGLALESCQHFVMFVTKLLEPWRWVGTESAKRKASRPTKLNAPCPRNRKHGKPVQKERNNKCTIEQRHENHTKTQSLTQIQSGMLKNLKSEYVCPEITAQSMDSPWTVHGLSMDCPWSAHGQSMNSPWIVHGLSMHCPRTVHGLSMSMDCP